MQCWKEAKILSRKPIFDRLIIEHSIIKQLHSIGAPGSYQWIMASFTLVRNQLAYSYDNLYCSIEVVIGIGKLGFDQTFSFCILKEFPKHKVTVVLRVINTALNPLRPSLLFLVGLQLLRRPRATQSSSASGDCRASWLI